MRQWPPWRLLVWTEAWLLAAAALHRWRPFHEEFLMAAGIAVAPALVGSAIWALGKARQPPGAGAGATGVEVWLAIAAIVAAAAWAAQGGLDARDDLRALDALLGSTDIVVDVSLTGVSVLACAAALAIDWVLSRAREGLRNLMVWVRRVHVPVTALHLLVLFGAAWTLARWPSTPDEDVAALFHRARAALHVYEYARATVLPVQSFFAALAVAIAVWDSRGR